MNATATNLRDALRILAPDDQAAALRRALDAGSIQSDDAASIARDLRFPGWGDFGTLQHAKVGTRPHGSSDQDPTAGAKPLPPTSALFLGSAFAARNAAAPNAGLDGARTKAKAVTRILGDDDQAKPILSILRSCSPAELNEVLSNVDGEKLFATVKDHKLFGLIAEGERYGAELAQLVTSDANLPALCVAVRTNLVDGMQKTDKGDVDDLQQAAIAKIFVSTNGLDLTALKNGIDLGDDQNNMHNLIYRSINHDELRAQMLRHIAEEAARTGPTGQVKGLFDVDDTFYVNFIDDSYPRGTVYPGTTEFHRELDLGPQGADRLGDNTFLSARPHDPFGLDEKHTLDTVHGKGEGPAAVITGDFLHLIGNQAIAAEKIKNYGEFSPIYPEYKKFFEGDSGQGDIYVAIELLSKHKDDVAAAYIHELPHHPTDPALRARAEQLGVVFYDTRAGQALDAYNRGLISKAGLGRVVTGAEADFAKVDFGGDLDTRTARKGELDRDCAAARRALAQP